MIGFRSVTLVSHNPLRLPCVVAFLICGLVFSRVRHGWKNCRFSARPKSKGLTSSEPVLSVGARTRRAPLQPPDPFHPSSTTTTWPAHCYGAGWRTTRASPHSAASSLPRLRSSLRPRRRAHRPPTPLPPPPPRPAVAMRSTGTSPRACREFLRAIFWQSRARGRTRK